MSYVGLSQALASNQANNQATPEILLSEEKEDATESKTQEAAKGILEHVYTKASTKKTAYEYVAIRAPVKELLAAQDVPQELKSMISSYINNAFFEEENLTMPNAIQPSIKLMRKIALNYLEKYSIIIGDCLDTELKTVLENMKNVHYEVPIGMIVTRPEFPEKVGHVTPILCDFTKGRSYVFSLDVLGIDFRQKEPGRTISQVCKKLNLSLRSSFWERQSDRVGCRTDALVILRNALLHIRSENIDLRSLITSCDCFAMPINWNYTDQITPKVLKEEESLQNTPVIRGRLSSKKVKEETVSAFRDRHRKEVTFKYSLTLIKDQISNMPDLSKLKLPPHMTVVEQENTYSYGIENQVVISWTTKRAVNTYITEKGFRDANKYLPKENRLNFGS